MSLRLSSETLHATTVALEGRAVLITGISGSGKSDLALQLIDRGFTIDTAPIGDVSWVEIDNHEDLARGREIACRY